MNAERWKQVDAILDAVLEIAPSDRSAFLDDKCGGDENLRLQVKKLLATIEKAEDFLEAAPVESVFRVFAEESSENLIGRQIGVYRLIRLIGQGGMGSVFLASRIDKEFRKEVAVKIVSSLWHSDEIKDNFRRERQILARLEHANIARLLDGGTTDEGIPFLVMEYVEGLPVTKYCKSKKFSVKEKLLLFLKICEAVKYAHQNLIIHRDLKPSNIMITEDGTPKLLDFGVAKLLNPALVDVTENFTIGANILTPGYASPEQLKNENITTASDVYSLGILLYELFTGKRPHDLKDKSMPEILHIVTEKPPTAPSLAVAKSELEDRKLNPQMLKGDLDTIILKSLAIDPNERYQTVEALCGDINRHLNDLPITARKPSAVYRFRKFTQRHKYGLAAAVLIFLLLSGWLASAIYVARSARLQARENLRRAYSADMNLAMQAYETANLTRLNEILARYENTDFKQNWEYRFLQNLAHPKGKLLTIPYQGEVWNVAFSPDGKKMATGCADGFARIYEIPGGKLLATTAIQEGNVWRVKFSPDGKFLATASGDMKSTSAKIWDAETGAETLSFVGHTARVRSIDFSPDGKLIATGSRDGTVRIRDAESGKELKKFALEKKGVPIETNDLQFTPDGKILIAATMSGVRAWEISSGEILFNLSEAPSAFSLAVSPDGKLLAHGGSMSKIYTYDAVTGKPISTIAGHEASINQVVFSPDGKLIASASSDRTIRFFDARSGAETQNLKAHLNEVWSVAFSPDGKFIATSGTDFNVFLWDTAEVMKTSSFDFWVGYIGGSSPISADRTKMAVTYDVSKDVVGQAIWNVPAKKRIVDFSKNEYFESRAFSPDGAILAMGNRKCEIVFWNVASGAEIMRFQAHDKRINSLAFSPDGRRLVSGSYDETVKIWNTENADLIRVLCRFKSAVSTLGISPDGSRVFAASLDATAKLFDLETGEIIADLGNLRKPILSVAFVPSGKTFATGDAGGVIEIRQTSDGKLLDTLTGNAGHVQALTYTPDSLRLASASSEGVIRLWDTETKAQVLAIRTRSATTTFLAFTPDGNTLISHGTVEKLKFWEAAPIENQPAENNSKSLLHE
jgi:WD40 repeat protein/serine/threonine protein kinase